MKYLYVNKESTMVCESSLFRQITCSVKLIDHFFRNSVHIVLGISYYLLIIIIINKWLYYINKALNQYRIFKNTKLAGASSTQLKLIQYFH